MTNVFKVISIPAALFLTSCGGGGGSGGGNASFADNSAPVGVSITSANAPAATAYAYSAVIDLDILSGYSSALVTGVSLESRRAGVVATSLKQLYKALEAAPLKNLATGVSVSETVGCAGGGSMTTAGNVATPDQISNGDAITITSDRCVVDGETFSGKIEFGFSNVSGTIGSWGPWQATLSLKFTGSTISGSGFALVTEGDMVMGINQTINQTNSNIMTASVTGKSLDMKLTISDGTVINRKLTDYSFKSTNQVAAYTHEADLTISGNSPKIGNTYFVVDTLAPFTTDYYSFNYPSSGSVKLTAPDKSSATLTALDATSVKVELDKNGDGTVDETINTTWTAIESGV